MRAPDTREPSNESKCQAEAVFKDWVETGGSCSGAYKDSLIDAIARHLDVAWNRGFSDCELQQRILRMREMMK